jgi:uncharacterized phage protein (TIGR02218 family)
MNKLGTLAKCWLFKLDDGKEIYCTEHDCPIEVQGKTYFPNNILDSSAIEYKADLKADNLEIQGVLNNNLLTTEELLAGRFNNAKVEVFFVNYQNPDEDRIFIHQGYLGQVKMGNGYFIAIVEGEMAKFDNTIGNVYSPLCRAQFCDSKCKISIQAVTQTSSITKIINNHIFYSDDQLNEEVNLFTGGSLKFLSGLNKGAIIPVKNYHRNIIELAFPPFNAVYIGDEFSITQGCDKTFYTCSVRYKNAKNFRGEPHLPGKTRRAILP